MEAHTPKGQSPPKHEPMFAKCVRLRSSGGTPKAERSPLNAVSVMSTSTATASLDNHLPTPQRTSSSTFLSAKFVQRWIDGKLVAVQQSDEDLTQSDHLEPVSLAEGAVDVGSAEEAPSLIMPPTQQRYHTPINQLAAVPWYFGILSRDSTTAMLRQQGDWLVRASTMYGYLELILTVLWDGRPRHYAVKRAANGYYRLKGYATPWFKDMPQLVENYRSKPIDKTRTICLKQCIERPNWMITSSKVIKDKEIGEGAFGKVFQGRIRLHETDDNYMPVAIKVCKDNPSEREIEEMIREAQLMAQYDHAHVVKFFGLAADQPPLMIIMEFCSQGALLGFLQNNRGKLKVSRKLRFCAEASDGLRYLSVDRKCVHRDVAARNCLVDEHTRIKISDFGLAYTGAYNPTFERKRKMPIKWLPPEALRKSKTNESVFNATTDVWSFGVLMWEIFNEGAQPWSELNNKEASNAIKRGEQLQLGKHLKIPKEVEQVMRSCWNMDPTKRAHFTTIASSLAKLGGGEKLIPKKDKDIKTTKERKFKEVRSNRIKKKTVVDQTKQGANKGRSTSDSSGNSSKLQQQQQGKKKEDLSELLSCSTQKSTLSGEQPQAKTPGTVPIVRKIATLSKRQKRGDLKTAKSAKERRKRAKDKGTARSANPRTGVNKRDLQSKKEKKKR